MPFEGPSWANWNRDVATDVLLEVVKDGKTVERLSLAGKNCFVLGRNSKMSDHTLDHPSLSRQHVAFVHDRHGRLHVKDLSSNGTFVNDKRVNKETFAQLANGDKLRFGESQRTYCVKGMAEGDNTKANNWIEENSAAMPGDKEMRGQLPMSFGKDTGQKKTVTELNQSNARKSRQAEIAAMTASLGAAPKGAGAQVEESKAQGGGEDEEQDEDEDEDEDDADDAMEEETPEQYARGMGIPVSHEIMLKGHDKHITTLTIDPKGSRFVTGSMDCIIKMWDFGGMDRSLKNFREKEPEEGNSIISLDYSPYGDRYICATGSSCPKIFDRECKQLIQFVKGDMYLHDPTHTEGHTHIVTGAQWHPNGEGGPDTSEQVLTSSQDGTVRVWKLTGKTHFGKLVNFQVLKLRSIKNGKKVPATCCAWNPSGSMIFGGDAEGSIHRYDIKSRYTKANSQVAAHQGEVCTITFSNASSDGGNSFATRGMDDTMKLWDVRNLSMPTKTLSNLPTYFPTANCAFSSDGTVVCTGTSVRKDEGTGLLVFFDVHSADVEPAYQIGAAPDASAVCVEWHPTINHIMVGTSKGAVYAFYDPALSQKGAMLSAGRKCRPKDVNDYKPQGIIVNPHALPMYRDENLPNNRKRKMDRKDPIKSKRPELPLEGKSKGGKIGTHSSFSTHYNEQLRKNGPTLREQDPRAEILKHAAESLKNPMWVGQAYSTTQPKNILADKTMEQEEQAVNDAAQDLLK
jgi:WD40 repeat protein/pSer/pThr/pTyr-binding forkhead associated (FHA) protein